MGTRTVLDLTVRHLHIAPVVSPHSPLPPTRRRVAPGAAARAFPGVLLALLATLALPATPLAQRAPPPPTPSVGTVIEGTIVGWPDSLPVVGALVGIDALGKSVLTNRQGRFRLTDLPAGTHTIRARQIGFRPASMTIRVLALGDVPSVEGRGYELALPRIPVILSTIAVKSTACRGAGFVDMDADPRIAPVLEQLRQNAERYRDLAERYPVEYSVARTRHFRTETGALFAEHADTVVRRSDVRRPYEPGRVLDRRFTSGRPVVEREMHVPSFADVAGERFQAMHCFKYYGMERVDGLLMHRVDFAPIAGTAETDVEGSLFIEAQTFLLRRSTFRLTKLPPNMRVRSIQVVTTYRELFPGVLVPDALTTSELVRGIKVGGARVVDFLQRDHLYAHRWVRTPDGDPARTEPARAERPPVRDAAPARNSAPQRAVGAGARRR